MFRRFLIAVLVFLIAVVVAADRVGALVAAHVLASKVQHDERFSSRPDASIGGFPFLTQAFSGKYQDVTIKATNIPLNGMTVTSMTAQLRGVHIPFIKVLHDTVSSVPVDRVDGTAFVAFGDIDAYLNSHHPAGQVLSLRAGTGDTATLLDRARVGGKTVSLRGVGRLSLSVNVIGVEITHLTSTSAGKSVGARQIAQVLKALRIALPLRSLPFRMQLHSVRIDSAGITVTGDALNTVLGQQPK